MERTGMVNNSLFGRLFSREKLDRSVARTEHAGQSKARELEVSFQAIFSHMREGVLITDQNTGLVVEANQAICRILGYSHQELTGHFNFTYLPYTPKTALPGVAAHNCLVTARKDGSSVYLEMTETWTHYNNVPHTIYILRDISAQVQESLQLEEARKQAVLEERKRLARELHDTVTQVLYGIELGANTALTLLQRDPQKVADQVEDVILLAAAGLTEMRSLLFELRPESLETEGLTVALEKQAEALRARYDLEVEVQAGDEPAIPLAHKEALYRIAQEAMNNIVKHARATQVVVRLQQLPQAVTLEVTDDGRGFDPTGKFPGHLGLISMLERATTLAGTLDISSTPDHGTCVRVVLPL